MTDDAAWREAAKKAASTKLTSRVPQISRRGPPPPKDAENVVNPGDVKLFEHLQWVWRGFNILSASRAMFEGGAQPISLTEILSYCVLEGIEDRVMRREFLFFIPKLDAVFLQYSREKMEHEREKAKQDAENKANGGRQRNGRRVVERVDARGSG